MRLRMMSGLFVVAAIGAAPLSATLAADFLVGGAIFYDCKSPFLSGVVGVTVTVDGTGGTFPFTSGGPGIWGGGIPEGTYTVTAALTGWGFCRTPWPVTPGNCPPALCENPFTITVDAAHGLENENLLIHGTTGDGCVGNEDCADGDECTVDVCDAGTCVSTDRMRNYGDVTPFGSAVPPCTDEDRAAMGDGFANMLDVFCAFNAFNEGFPYSQCPCGDVSPCAGDGFVNMLDVFALFNAFNGNPACSAPCP